MMVKGDLKQKHQFLSFNDVKLQIVSCLFMSLD